MKNTWLNKQTNTKTGIMYLAFNTQNLNWSASSDSVCVVWSDVMWSGNMKIHESWAPPTSSQTQEHKNSQKSPNNQNELTF